MQLVVVGMHRSGTSAVTGLLSQCEIHAGAPSEHFPFDAWNPKGYWERKEVVAINELALSSVGKSWLDVEGFEPDLVPPETRAELDQRISQLVGSLDEHRPWVIKDPRFCFTLSLWLEHLVDPICVMAYRHPGEVALSLKRRHEWIPLEFGLALWERYVMESIALSRGLPRVSVCYNRLLDDPSGETSRLVSSLRSLMGDTLVRAPSASQLSELIDKSLSHCSAGAHDAQLSPSQEELWEALRAERWETLEDMAGAGTTDSWFESLAPVLYELTQLDERYRALKWQHEQRLDEGIRSASAMLQTELEAKDQALAGLRREAELRVIEVEALQAETQTLRVQLDEHEARLREAQCREQTSTADLERLSDELRIERRSGDRMSRRSHRLEHMVLEAIDGARTLDRLLSETRSSESWRVGHSLTRAFNSVLLRSRSEGTEDTRFGVENQLDALAAELAETSALPSLSVCVLTQNNCRTIGSCLASVAEFADEIIVVDSNSSDGTLDVVADEPKVRVIAHDFADIASQRNVYLGAARCDWILSLDADEVMGSEFATALPRLLRYPDYVAYWFPRYWLCSLTPLRYVVNDRTYPDIQLRLIRNRPGLEFRNRVHQAIDILGRHLVLDEPHLFHLHYLLHDREQREARLSQYEQLSRGSGSGIYRSYYIYEETSFRVEDCQEELNLGDHELQRLMSHLAPMSRSEDSP